jgi:hypothetical protein
LLEIASGIPINTVEKCKISLLNGKSIMAKSVLGVKAKLNPSSGEVLLSKINVL